MKFRHWLLDYNDRGWIFYLTLINRSKLYYIINVNPSNTPLKYLKRSPQHLARKAHLTLIPPNKLPISTPTSDNTTNGLVFFNMGTQLEV